MNDFETVYRNEIEHKSYLNLSVKEACKLIYDKLINDINDLESEVESLEETIEDLEMQALSDDDAEF